ncbi:hypothetical protein A2U01_0044422, partial [Trifolium medium]|nr:hypothetical protein [Trifolium medium]
TAEIETHVSAFTEVGSLGQPEERIFQKLRAAVRRASQVHKLLRIVIKPKFK